MSTTPLRVAAGVARLWTRTYTLGLPADIREARLTEIESDLWEGQHDSGRPASAVEMLNRVVLGVPHDLLWRIEQAADGSARTGVAPARRSVTVSAFTCSLAVHLIVLAGTVWWASWPTERTPPRVWTSHTRMPNEEPRALVAAPLAISEPELNFGEKRRQDVMTARGFPDMGVAGVFVTPVSGLSRQPIHLPGTWVLDLSRTDPSHDWEATVPSGAPPPPPPPGAASLTIARKGTDLVIGQKWDAGSQSITCELVDANTFDVRSKETMSELPSTIAFWDGTQAVIRVLVSLRLPRDAALPVELRMRYRADETTLSLNSETRMPNGVYTRRFVYSRQK